MASLTANPNYTVRWVVRGTVWQAVRRAVNDAVYGTLDGDVCWGVNRAVGAAVNLNEHGRHPGLQDFLLDVGLTPDG
jgi:hypothetical protein